MNARPGSELLPSLLAMKGAGAEFVELAGDGYNAAGIRPGLVRIGLHRTGPLPPSAAEAFDILLTAQPGAPRPWVSVPHPDAVQAALTGAIERQPAAAAVAAQVLRIGEALTFDDALLVESFAYSMLLASQGFRSWRAQNQTRPRRESIEPRVLSSRQGELLSIRLNRPEARNAFDAALRDELVAALEFAMEAGDVARVELRGEGPIFSAGGDLDEFGSAHDVGLAHLIRTLQSPARLVWALGTRAHAHVHGACIGAGIEVPAAAHHVSAATGTGFRLPEVGMGLIPGAGGTASIPRRIGRHRTCYMAIAGADIDCETALAWGLIDEVKL